MMPGGRLQGQEAPANTSDSTPSPKSHHLRKKKSTPEKSEEAPPTRPAPHQKVDPDNESASTAINKKKAVVDGESNAAETKSESTAHAPAATIEAGQIADFSAQPDPVQHLIKAALDLTKLNLAYTYGSDEPSSGGMDCSGTIYYLLRSQGIKDVPRDSSEQYIWARQHGQFFAVVSTEADGFEFKDLQPGDLMFWSGTYKTERIVPITHVMLYLGREKESGKRIMFGSSDGRSYHGIQRWGVSVFDFTMPKANPATPEKHVNFVGYARIPALRELPTVVAKTTIEVTSVPKPIPAAVWPESDALREPERGSAERKAIMDALRAGRFAKEANNVIFQVNYLKVHNGWAWASVTPQDHNGIRVAARCSALLHFEDGMWKAVEPGKLPIDTAKMNGEKSVDRAFVKSLLEVLPAVPVDIFPKQME